MATKNPSTTKEYGDVVVVVSCPPRKSVSMHCSGECSACLSRTLTLKLETDALDGRQTGTKKKTRPMIFLRTAAAADIFACRVPVSG